MLDKALPFPRGKTLCDGVITPTATSHLEYCGREYRVSDTVHSTQREVVLIPLKLEAAITVDRKLYKFGTSALDFGRTIAGVNDVAGGVCLALDDKYTLGATLAQYDVAWFVLRGPCDVDKAGNNLATGEAVASNSVGQADTAGANYNCIVGTCDQATTAAAGTATVINMNVTLANGT